MSAAVYLIDTSALARILKDPVRSTWKKPLEEGIIAVCPITEIEYLYSARNAEDRVELAEDLKALFSWALMDDRAYAHAWDVQKALTGRSQYRSAGAVDLLVAATAELQRLTVLHYDNDFETIAAVTRQPTQWLAPPGTL
ncbi:PIN domain nuclease [Streptomyces sp. H10-C2]|uniref:PIN domain nuclease n=1 Tax=unclassified Streptomyces TaxID=2593676 RepID=UPI0024BA6E71|nr:MULTISPECIES: PIN domain nuclease [unclassified Streptomyces]MDJ0342674.1 PIN domain nuclease [Streptomyces sp. PH10-H1]MDJ0372617.1 PIN domain nuclease [Streptomyces sp. H10-C2]